MPDIIVTNPAPIVVQVKQVGKTSVTAPSTSTGGGSVSSGNAFGVINIAGQNNVVAQTSSDVLHLIAGTGILLTTDNVNNAVTLVATGGSATDQFARDHSNGAFDQANTANVTGQAAFDKANGAIYTAAQIRANISNTAPINYDSTSGVISHALSGVTTTTYGNTTFVPQVTVDNKGHVTSASNVAITFPPDQFARDKANGAFDQANSAALRANTLVTDNVPETTTNLYFTAARVRANVSNAAPVSYNTSTGQFGIVAANANGSLLISNTISGSYDVSQLTAGYGIIVTPTPGGIQLDAAVGKTYYLVLSQASDIASYNVAITAPSANAETNTSATYTGTAFSLVSVFATVAGEPGTSLLPAGTYGRHFHVTTDGASNYAQLRVELYKRLSNTTEILLRTNDSPIFSSANADVLLSWNVTDPNSYPLDMTDRFVWKVYVRRVSGGSGSVVVTVFYEGTSRASYFPTSILGASSDQFARAQANAAYDRANSAALRANTLVTDNVPETTTNLYFTAARVRANISNTTPVNYDPATGIISHATSGVTATTYGDSTHIPQITVDNKGHVTVASNIAISGLPASTANGQLLIGNTVSSGFDVNTLTQGTGIVITNDKGSITIAATGGSSIDQFARDHSNGAFDKANGAIYTAAQIRANISNTAPINYDPTTGIISHLTGFIPGGVTYGDINQSLTIGLDDYGHVNVVGTGLIQIDASQIGGATVNGQLLIANTINGLFDVQTLTQGTGIVITNGPGTITIAATGGSSVDQYARDKANGAVQTAFVTINANGTNLVPASNNDTLSISGTVANGIYVSGNTVSNPKAVELRLQNSGVTATGYGTASQIPVFVVDAFGRVTSVTNTAISGLDASVLSTGILQVARGGTGKDATGLVNGAFLIGNTVNTGFDLTTLGGGGSVTITNGQGTVAIDGNVTWFRSNITATSPIVWTQATGIITHATSGVAATGYGDAATVPKIVVDDKGHATSITNTAIAIAASAITSGILSVARGGTGKDATGLVNGQLLIANTVNTGFDLASPTGTAPIVATLGKGTLDFSHATSGVTASGYGTASQIPVFVVNDKGHITSVTNTAITGLDASTITTGILQVARGGTGKDATGLVNGALLIGNTVNTGFDLTTLSSGGSVTITNGRGTIAVDGNVTWFRSNITATSPIVWTQATGIITHATSGVTATGYGDAATVPKFVVDDKGHVTSVTNTTIAITTSQVSESAGGPFFHTAARVRGNVSNTAPINYDATTGIFSHADSGVVATGHGDAATIPKIIVDATGHVTSVTNTAIAIAASQITSGTLGLTVGGTGRSTTIAANGQLLIGNTVSSGFDVSTLTAGAGILINNLKGSIEIVATGGSSTDQFARDTANGAFAKANNATPNTGVTVNGSMLIGNTVSGGFDLRTITQSVGVQITNGRGTITIAANVGNTLPISWSSNTANISHAAPLLGNVAAGTLWTKQATPGNTNESWGGVAWSNALAQWCAVSYGTTGLYSVMTSPDGVYWTGQTTGVPVPKRAWRNITWAPELGLYCAVCSSGTGQRVMTSPDGVTWTSRTTPADNDWKGLVWNGRIFVSTATAGTNRLMTSINGVDWVGRASTTEANQWISVGWNGNTFVAISATGAAGTQVMTSLDGVTWVSRSESLNANWLRIGWNGNAWVALGSGGEVMTSPQGVAWTTRTSITNAITLNNQAAQGLINVGTTGTTFIATGGANGSFGSANAVAMVSTDDGVTWTIYDGPTQVIYGGLAANDNRLIVTTGVSNYTNQTDACLTCYPTRWTPGANVWTGGQVYGDGRNVPSIYVDASGHVANTWIVPIAITASQITDGRGFVLSLASGQGLYSI